MFEKSQRFYDAVYSFKDYPGEADVILHKVSDAKPQAKTLLDVACGTGMHLAEFKRNFEVFGVDADPEMIRFAQERVPSARFFSGDMRSFSCGMKFDVITCLFSSIGYVEDVQGLEQALANFAAHLNPGGLAIVEPWLSPENYKVGNLSSIQVDKENLKIARFSISEREGNQSVLRFHYLVATNHEINHFEEIHRMGLFTQEEYLAAFEKAGMSVEYDAEGLIGRGLLTATMK